jgi:hypothetical protein
VSAIEQEPQQGSLAAVTTEAVILQLQVPGSGLDTPLSAVTQKTTPFKVVRVRGIAWISSATVAHLSGVRLRQGTTIGGVQVGPAFAAQTATTDPTGGSFVSFEFIDTAPVGLVYVITAASSASATVNAIASVTGFNV